MWGRGRWGYGRCFGGGIRLRLRRRICWNLPNNELDYYKALRERLKYELEEVEKKIKELEGK